MKTYVTKPKEVARKWLSSMRRTKRWADWLLKLLKFCEVSTNRVLPPMSTVGNFVIVINAEKIGVTGRRLEQKTYYRHSQYPGGLTEIKLRHLLEKHPTRPIKFAVKGMLPKGPLGRQMLTKLKVYAGPDHPHEAQQPEVLEL